MDQTGRVGLASGRQGLSLPPILWWALGGLMLNYTHMLAPWGLLPAGVTGLAWLLPLLAALWQLALGGRPALPVRIWLPWVAWVVLYCASATAPNALQRTAMLLAPFFVGAAVSLIRPWPSLPAVLTVWLERYALLFLALSLLQGGLWRTLHLATALSAPGSMTAIALACWFSTRAATGNSRMLLWWAGSVAVPFMALTRMAMLGAVVTLPLTLAPLGWRRRALIVVVVGLAGLAAFQSERVQHRMFYSGHGTVRQAFDGLWDMLHGQAPGTGLATTGRWLLNQRLLGGIAEAPWFGHGTNAAESVAMRSGGLTHPHNDWLRFAYDYGGVGVALFVAAVGGQMWHAVRSAGLAGAPAAGWLWAGASMFIPMALLMVSDNVVLYVSWFGNLQFALLGFGYALARAEQERRPGCS